MSKKLADDYETTRKQGLRAMLMAELNLNDISVRSWKRNGGGAADFNLQLVDIPRPLNPYLLGVGFHEIGHIVLHRNNSGYSQMPSYIMEYMAEIYAINKLKEYGQPTREYRAYATKYVLTCLASYKNKGGSMDMVPNDIRKWAGVRVTEWKAAKKVVVENIDVDKLSDIRIKYHM